jgi:hypothetical protein
MDPSDTGNASAGPFHVDVGCNEGDLTLEVARAILIN